MKDILIVWWCSYTRFVKKACIRFFLDCSCIFCSLANETQTSRIGVYIIIQNKAFGICTEIHTTRDIVCIRQEYLANRYILNLKGIDRSSIVSYTYKLSILELITLYPEKNLFYLLLPTTTMQLYSYSSDTQPIQN